MASVFVLICMNALTMTAQDQPAVEEIPLQVVVPGVGTTMTPALVDDRGVLLPVADLFAFMQIRVDLVENSDNLTGYLMREDETYEIDPSASTVTVEGRREHLPITDLISFDGRLYLRSDRFGPLFGLECTFDSRALEVRFVRNNDIPAVRASLRSGQRPGAFANDDPALVPVDREVYPSPAVGNVGALDWDLTATTTRDGGFARTIGLDFGGELAGGSVESSLLISDVQATTWRSATVQWHRVLDLPRMLPQQVQIGSIGRTPSGPMVGGRITNRTTEGHRAFGTYLIKDRTEPEWIVELYLNYQLVDLVKTDQTGEYRFEIPLWYGTTRATLKFYGPYGEERTYQRTIIIPYTFLPAGDIEYTGAAGMIAEESSMTPAANGKASLGVTSWLTLGAGVDWERRGMARDLTQSYTMALRLGDNLLCQGTYSPNDQADGSVGVILPFKSSLDLSWRSDLTNVIQQDEYRAVLDVPIEPLLGSLTLAGSYRTIGSSEFRRAGGGLNASVFGLPISMSSNLEWSGTETVDLTSARGRFAASFFLPMGTMLRPIVEMDWLTRKPLALAVEGNISVTNGTALYGSVTHVNATGQIIGTLGLRLDLPFTHVSTGAVSTGTGTITRSTISGSLWMDAEEGAMLVRGESSIGRGGLTVRPFLDLDDDGVRDDDEPLLPNTALSINGGIATTSLTDSVIRVVDLQPFIPYILTVSEIGFENLNWRPRYATWRVKTLPNVFETIDVPIIVTGEVEGIVERLKEGEMEGVFGLRVLFTAVNGDTIATTITEQGGGFLYIGLPAGEYVAQLDGDQLQRLRLVCDQPSVPVTIRSTPEGDLVEGLRFVVRRK